MLCCVLPPRIARGVKIVIYYTIYFIGIYLLYFIPSLLLFLTLPLYFILYPLPL